MDIGAPFSHPQDVKMMHNANIMAVPLAAHFTSHDVKMMHKANIVTVPPAAPFITMEIIFP